MKTTRPQKLTLTIERADGVLWGRTEYDDNLLVESSDTQEGLETSLKTLLHDFHDLDPAQVEFTIEYDLTAFFQEFDFLKITKIAELAGLNGSLLRQYVSGKKNPSPAQAQKIETAIHQLGDKLAGVHLYA